MWTNGRMSSGGKKKKDVTHVVSYFHRANGRPAVAVFPPCSQEQGEEIRAPSADQHIPPQPHVLLLVKNNSCFNNCLGGIPFLTQKMLFFFSPGGKQLDIKKSSYKKVHHGVSSHVDVCL